MRALELNLKFGANDTVYTTKQTKLVKSCHVCEGSGRINFNEKDMKCPECMGAGKFQSNKQVHVVCEEPFIITKTKVDISNDGNLFVKYKGRCGFSTLNRAEENLFASREEAQKRCDELNRERIFIRADEIAISDDFRNTQPSIDKIQEKLEYYKIHRKFDRDIVIDTNKVLQDGYINYLICNLLNIDTVKVVIQ